MPRRKPVVPHDVGILRAAIQLTAAGSVRGFARLVGRDEKNVRDWKDGKRQPPKALIDRCRSLILAAGFAVPDPPPQPTD